MGIVSRSSSDPVIGVVLPLAVTCTLLQALLQYVFIVLQYIVWFERHFSMPVIISVYLLNTDCCSCMGCSNFFLSFSL